MAKFLRLKTPSRCSKKMYEKKVTFSDAIECKLCDDHFDRNDSLQRTSFHIIKRDLTKTEVDNASMIVDLGCPNSLLGKADVGRFVKSLSHFQEANMRVAKVDESFKFGPRGPYRCIEKMKIPLGYCSDCERKNTYVAW